MKRLTIHLKRVPKKTDVIDGKSVSKIINTLSFKVENEDEANRIIANINPIERA